MKRLVLIVSIGLLLAAGASSSLAQSGSGYDLTWSVISSGGQSSSGGAYSLGGTIGQADTGAMVGGTYTLGGGVWSGTPAVHRVYLPLTLK